jgi:hypothetical protein
MAELRQASANMSVGAQTLHSQVQQEQRTGPCTPARAPGSSTHIFTNTPQLQKPRAGAAGGFEHDAIKHTHTANAQLPVCEQRSRAPGVAGGASQKRCEQRTTAGKLEHNACTQLHPVCNWQACTASTHRQDSPEPPAASVVNNHPLIVTAAHAPPNQDTPYQNCTHSAPSIRDPDNPTLPACLPTLPKPRPYPHTISTPHS